MLMTHTFVLSMTLRPHPLSTSSASTGSIPALRDCFGTNVWAIPVIRTCITPICISTVFLASHTRIPYSTNALPALKPRSRSVPVVLPLLALLPFHGKVCPSISPLQARLPKIQLVLTPTKVSTAKPATSSLQIMPHLNSMALPVYPKDPL